MAGYDANALPVNARRVLNYRLIWWRTESSANRSPMPISVLTGKNTGNCERLPSESSNGASPSPLN